MSKSVLQQLQAACEVCQLLVIEMVYIFKIPVKGVEEACLEESLLGLLTVRVGAASKEKKYYLPTRSVTLFAFASSEAALMSFFSAL